MSGLRKAKTKLAFCTHCGGANEVAARAMSVFCAHCRKRLILENYVIKSYQAVSGYSTCGDVSVEKKGRVAAPIQSNSLTVKGKVSGDVEARGMVEVTSTGSLEGRLKATSLLVLKGASFDGYCEIRPAADVENVIVQAETDPAENDAAEKKTKTKSTTGVKKLSTVRAVTTTKKTPRASASKPKAEASTKKVAATKVQTKKVAANKEPKSSAASASGTPVKKSKIKAISTRRRSKFTSPS